MCHVAHLSRPQVAEKVARMDICMAEVLRATRAHQAFQNTAEALRPDFGGNFYSKSVSERDQKTGQGSGCYSGFRGSMAAPQDVLKRWGSILTTKLVCHLL